METPLPHTATSGEDWEGDMRLPLGMCRASEKHQRWKMCPGELESRAVIYLLVGGIATGILDQIKKYTWVKLLQLRSIKHGGGAAKSQDL